MSVQEPLNLFQKKITQRERVLRALKNAKEMNGEGWVDGMFFLSGGVGKPVTQFHARIFELEREGIKIESAWSENGYWKKYRLAN